ncbi:hypothetical protein JGU42_04230 [Porphyromonas gingivalis]|uniref:hypothetical protein n=1 Tax=Porphyromonas gingivalis TaxID=837 RepID=UPI001F161D5D|nr:hypothetical protein [Porphyromonas gingivalis]MCE8178484.1 hypothetical protein [Porphyromonas gingivalis]
MLTLAISTSSGQFALALGINGELLYRSGKCDMSEDLDAMLNLGLASCGKQVKDICSIVVDIGPGGTSRVRTGVAFANSLSYTLSVPIYTASSMELAGIEAQDRWKIPVVTTVRSIKGNAYIGLYDNKLVCLEFGLIQDIVPQIVQHLDAFVVVGYHRSIIKSLFLEEKKIVDSEMNFGDVKFLIQKETIFKQKEGLLFPNFAKPIVETVL